jgi:hypothetical protein
LNLAEANLRPRLAFDLGTIEHSSLRASRTSDPAIKQLRLCLLSIGFAGRRQQDSGTGRKIVPSLICNGIYFLLSIAINRLFSDSARVG